MKKKKNREFGLVPPIVAVVLDVRRKKKKKKKSFSSPCSRVSFQTLFSWRIDQFNEVLVDRVQVNKIMYLVADVMFL